MRLALAQINSVVGDLDGNRDRVLARLEEAKGEGAALVLFPELVVTGYPPEDLLLRPSFVRAAERTLNEIARAARGVVALVGVPLLERDLFNACAVCAGGEVKARYRKRFLPNYGVFDEDRYFAPGDDLLLLEHGRTLVGPTICEDVWQPGPPATDLALAGAELIANISASPFHVGKDREREEMLVTRARDYVEKNGFREVVVGVSGGIDSALVAALAAEALGPERVHCVSMPSQFSSKATRSDARRLAEGLGCPFTELPIEPIVEEFRVTLAPVFGERGPDPTEENVQARTRGVLLMALSNKFGWLLVATGNKSELSVGYATLYGDMAGGFALLKDVFKTDVFRLARHLNERFEVARAGEAGAGSSAASQATPKREMIPQSIVDRAASAELRADQLDEDSLPPYPALDRVLEAYVEQDRSREVLTGDGFDRDVVDRAIAMIDRAEYKRRQAPPGGKLRPKAFGRDRRTPITNRWRD